MTTSGDLTGADEVGDRLRRFLADQPDARDGEITGLTRAGSGRSRDNWLFDLTVDGAVEPLILRTDPEGGLIDTDRAVEFGVLRGLEKSGLPTPIARWLDADGSALGRPSLIMRRLPGSCDYRVLRDPARPLEERVALARTFCELLAAVHAVDWPALGLGATLPDPGPKAARAELERWAGVLRADQLEPWPEIEYAIAVLGERAPRSAGTVLVHADFKPGNILLLGDQVSALLDWELAHLGDPLEDLGWVTQPLRAGEHTIDGAWAAADLVAHYERTSGNAVDPTALAWWVAFSTFKTAVMQVSGLRAFLEERADEPYRPTRRVLATMLDAVLEGVA
ncbi:phosphotransferase family protein [Amycolatopsis acidiphila]|uniref:Phosphotransferase family protein n=1 Tax=Amycolatopsis acidiphila TaxID=715473 RepID=A0A558ANZ4_9PSEU|nr:phosphotransferase family protein [Amycolatopsis acidiphila]TVT25980.1 phosphotransferase family protein [Amycolatopsis acidiphila]UIJ63305.1 phosphotransferase family protein [Amycolatopsis acidiphila]GHG74919.1 aminoglycoside phosphotransferase [Amycolatopsis acidiphila]